MPEAGAGSFCEGSYDLIPFFQRIPKHRQILFNNRPDDIHIQAQIIMDQDIAKTGNFAPRNMGCCIFEGADMR